MHEPSTLPDMTCLQCSEKLVVQKTYLTYLGFPLSTPLPRCPICGQVYISEAFAAGKLHDVEKTLEDK